MHKTPRLGGGFSEGWMYLLDKKPMPSFNCRSHSVFRLHGLGGWAGLVGPGESSDNFSESHGLCTGDNSFKFLPYQLSMVCIEAYHGGNG